MFNMTIKVSDQRLKRMLNEFEERKGDLTKVWKKLGKELEDEFKENFDDSGRRLGSQWQRLSPATLAAKVRLGFSTKPLIATRRLMRSFRTLDIGKMFVKVGTDVEYSQYHQTGTSRMPKREIIGIPTSMKGKIADRIMEHIMKAFDRL